MNKYKEALSNIHKHGKTMTWDDAGAIIESLKFMINKETKPLCGEFSFKDKIECIHPDWNARTDCRSCERIIMNEKGKEIEKLEVGVNINCHTEKINDILNDFKIDKIDKYRMDLLIANELIGIQNQCKRLGVCYID